jgi:hypothetical protein
MGSLKIDIHNYEAWLLDFAEGNLSPTQEQSLRAFIAEHPELDIQLDDMDLFYLDEDKSDAFSLKSSLKKDDAAKEEVEQILFDAIEDPSKMADAEKVLAVQPQLNIDFEAYKKTILQPELEIVFEAKASLKKALVEADTLDHQIFEAIETNDKNAIQQLSQIDVLAVKAFQAARLDADQSITYPHKKELKKSLFIVFEQKTLVRLAAILIGVSLFGTFTYKYLQSEKVNTGIAKNDPTSVQTNTKKPEVINGTEVPSSKEAKQNIIESNSISVKRDQKLANNGATNKTAVLKANTIDTTSKKTISLTPEVSIAQQTPVKIDSETTITALNPTDPTVLALENKSVSNKVAPTIVLQDIEEVALDETKEPAKDPLLYKAANKFNEVLSFIGTKKIPVSKKTKKGNVSYELGQNLLRYSTNQKMQP